MLEDKFNKQEKIINQKAGRKGKLKCILQCMCCAILKHISRRQI